MWIITYFWYTVDPAHPGPVCGPILHNLAVKNGLNLDGTPIIKTSDELNNQLEANGCGAEGQEDVGGADGGAVWLICPAIMDPRNGAIAKDAFLDQVRYPNFTPLDPAFTRNFNCLQQTGQFPQPNGTCPASLYWNAVFGAGPGPPETVMCLKGPLNEMPQDPVGKTVAPQSPQARGRHGGRRAVRPLGPRAGEPADAEDRQMGAFPARI
jgi:hypothetical protein